VLLVHHGVSPVFRLVLFVAVGALLFALACAWREPEVLAELKRLRPSLKRQSAVFAQGSGS
jgi:outer membrane lipoprotein-sorting protein